MKNYKKILIIIQRSNGDVFLASSLVKALHENYKTEHIDLLVNDDTHQMASLLPFIRKIHTFSYQKKNENRWGQEKIILSSIFKKYDLSINLTASDRSVFYALIAGKKSISAIEKNNKKSWWKKILLNQYYYFDTSQHILKNNLEALNLLDINFDNVHYPINISNVSVVKIKAKLKALNISEFIIFHPSAQYYYKIYPHLLRDQLLTSLSKLGLPILVTGGRNKIDLKIKKQLSVLPNIFDFIGETSLEEYFYLSELSCGYIGMDTLNMHIAASQNKRIFAIFGPTNLKMWAPWSNKLKISATLDKPIQTYGNITIFQADIPCVACGMAGCNDMHGNSDCLDLINPKVVFNEIYNWYHDVSI